ncbi:hypothetical protein SLEP1_g15863 [Rubroshorea leprosula]|uniref:Uncharacterized protein n=1 Tax=Rubroshorea leprosula TaxID=152421 RepID=A0AAV5IWK1_9ROSI|nr:hypothetical protein SLEP1_g15863 [Rubroshorea leprosula]
MTNPLEALRMHLLKSAENGSPSPFSSLKLLCLLQHFLCGIPGYKQNIIAPGSKRRC